MFYGHRRQINKLTKYIGKLTLSENDTTQARALLRDQKEIDSKSLLDAAFTHHVLPQIYTHLRWLKRGNPEVERSVSQFLDMVRDEVNRRKKHMARFHRELERFAEDAEAQDVRYVAVKGLCLQNLYSGDAFRDMSDMDLLVAPESGWKGIEVLKRQGYYVKRVRLERYPYSWRLQEGKNSGVFGVAEMVSREDPELVFLGDTKPMAFDLHLGAFPGCGDSILESELWQRSENISAENRYVHYPSYEDSILIMCAHIARHGFAKLKDLNDTAAILKRCQNNLDWNYLCTYAEKNNLDLVLHSLLNQLKIEYGVLVPEGIQSKRIPYLLKNLISYMLFSTGKGNRKFHGGRQLLLGRFIQVILLFRYYKHRSSWFTAVNEAGCGMFFLFRSGRPYKLWDQRIVHSFERNRRIVVIPIQSRNEGKIWDIRDINLAQAKELGNQIGISVEWLNDQTLAWNQGQKEELVLTPYDIYTQSAYDGHMDKITLEKTEKVAWETISRLVEANVVSAKSIKSN